MDTQLTVGGRVVASWDPVRHPHWPPVDSNGEIVSDVPWKFFDPKECQERQASGG
jgi:hypothetical protein